MAKKSTVLVKLVSSEGSGHFYVKKKNPKKFEGKLNFKKYDPKLMKHVMFEEKKLTS